MKAEDLTSTHIRWSGALLGKWPSEALTTPGQADGFGSRAATVAPRSLRNAGLTETLMFLESCEFCPAGAAHLSSADLRCRRHGRSCFGAEGFEGARSAACSQAASAPKERCAATRGRCERVKRAPYGTETRDAACKGVSAVRRHAGGLYDARSYCYTLVKCLKPFVRVGKGVIEANDYTQGPPINNEPLVMKRTHCNEKRAPKATASLLVFGLLSISLFPLLCC
jgi:hypothetical protein